MGLFGGLFGGGDKMRKVPTMTKEQKRLLSSLMEMLGGEGGLGQGFGEQLDYQRELMDPTSAAVQRFTEPYERQFQEQTIPQLAERFAGADAMGSGLSSSGFGQSLGAAGAGLQGQLAQLRAGLGQQAAGNLASQFQGLTGQALGAQPFGYHQQLPSMAQGALGGWAAGGFPGLSSLWGNYGPIIGNV